MTTTPKHSPILSNNLILSVAIFWFLITHAFAQQAKITEAYTSLQKNDLDNAVKAIEIATSASETSNDPKAWYYKGFIYKEVYKRKESTADDSPARQKSLDALSKCISIDPKNQFAEESKKVVKFLSSTFKNDGAKALNARVYNRSITNYENYLASVKLFNPTYTDTSAIFFIGYAAYESKDYTKALIHLKKAIDLNYNDPHLYYILSRVYLDRKDNENAIKVLEQGQKRYPNDKDILTAEVIYYKETGKIDELESKLKKSISLEPKNTELQMMLALVYEKKMESVKDNSKKAEFQTKATDSYSKVLSINPNHLQANYNLAILYYNEAVTKIQQSEYETDIIALSNLQDECILIFKKSLPYMEKAYALDPKNKNTLTGLSGIYFSLNEEEKSNKFKAELDALNLK